MENLFCAKATREDIPFLNEVYHENIAALHGIPRTPGYWEALLADPGRTCYVVHRERPVAWFRIDMEEGGFCLGMLQVKPLYQRQGIGRYVLSVAEAMAREKGCPGIGIHATQDNLAARALYSSAGYAVTQIGPCTTGDDVERVGYTFEKSLTKPDRGQQ